MQTTTLVAPDISCETCQRAILGALGKLAGVSNTQVDIPSKQIQVTYDPEQVTQKQIEEVLDDTGFPVVK
jgi:copper chaperone